MKKYDIRIVCELHIVLFEQSETIKAQRINLINQ